MADEAHTLRSCHTQTTQEVYALRPAAIFAGSIAAMSRPEAKPRLCEQRVDDPQNMVVCQFCGVSVAETALQQHNFWNIACLQQQQQKAGKSERKAKKTAQKLYELRLYKVEQVQAELRTRIAARPGAKAMAKPTRTQKRSRRTSA